MEGHCSTGQSSQWAVVPVEEEEEEEEDILPLYEYSRYYYSTITINFITHCKVLGSQNAL